MKSLIYLSELDRSQLDEILAAAEGFRRRIDSGDPGPLPAGGKPVGMIFCEPSTRTRLSFELAALNLGARPLVVTSAGSSIEKGESLRDTASALEAMGAVALVVRHGQAGAPARVAEWCGIPVVNAGDGTAGHPTQALADLLTLQRHFGDTAGLRLGIVGDVRHSRVAASLLRASPGFGIEVVLAGPDAFLPERPPVPTAHDLDPLLPELDVVYLLRVQLERGARPGGDYASRFGLTRDRVARMRPEAVIMHPGPLNRGVEISDDAADSPRSLVLEQVANGVPVRMAVLSSIGVGGT